MTKYHACFKREGETIPSSVNIESKEIQDAIAEMCRLAGTTTTSGIAEFEILEVVPGGGYISRAIKVSKQERENRRSGKPHIKLANPSATPVNSSTSERKYTPYKLAAA